MRLQRALARAGVASRRASEELIRQGRVRVNDTVAVIGTVVDVDVDRITVGNRPLRLDHRVVWLALNKPTGHVTTRRDPEGRPTVYDLVPEIPGLTYVGRLDVMTEGLLLFTTDGNAVHRLTHPRFQVERTYRATVRGKPPARIRRMLAGSVQIGGRAVDIRRCEVRAGKSGDVVLRLTLVEGRNRIVRRMCEEMGLTVRRLVRLSHGPIAVDGIAPGTWRYLSPSELDRMRRLTR